MMEKGNWSGGFVDGDGDNVWPYKVEDGPTDVHEVRHSSVVEGEMNDPQNYRG